MAVKLALELGPTAHAWPIAERPEHARALARGSRPMLLVKPALQNDRLVVGLEVLAPKPDPKASVDEPIARFVIPHWLDAEVRRFLQPVTIAKHGFRRLAAVDSDTIALACGEVWPTGIVAVATAGRKAVSVAALQGELVAAPTLRPSWRELSEVAPKPLREPLASVTFTPSGAVLVGSTDRAHGKRLVVGATSEWRDLDARLPWPGGGCANLDGLFVAPRAVPCMKGEPATTAPLLREPLDAIAGTNLVSRAGTLRLVRAGRSSTDGSVTVSDGAREVRLEHAGAALALADLDGDGAPELLTSLDTADPSEDALVVYSWLGAELKERLRVPVPDGVRAIAACPQPESGVAPVLLVAGNAIWMLK
jgi:hypothetical protein